MSEAAAWASFDPAWNRLILAYRTAFLGAPQLQRLLQPAYLRRAVGPSWPYIPPAPTADEPADPTTQPWPLRSRGYVTQEGLLSQQIRLHAQLMEMVLAWQNGLTVAQQSPAAAPVNLADAAIQAVTARATVTPAPAIAPRRVPLYQWDAALRADCEQLVPSPRPQRQSRGALAAVAADNQQRLANGTFMHGSITVHTPPAGQLPLTPRSAPTSVAVADCDGVTAVLALAQRAVAGSPPPAILNFANAEQRGGGYVTGATAQEEDLCRAIPALYPALTQLVYPLDPASVPAATVLVVRDPATYTVAPFVTPVVVLTSAALDMRSRPARAQPLPTASEYNAEMQRRTRAVLFAAHAAGCRDLVLGPWGCGVFANDATAVANLFASALELPEWRFKFDSIVFAVPRPGRGTVSQIFSSRLQRLMLIRV